MSQTTVSMALRGAPAISAEVRGKILSTAKTMGYQPNMYANRLTAHIRSGKKLSDKDVIALVVDARSPEEWQENATYCEFYRGVCQKAFELGLEVETFFLQKPGMNAEKIDRILYSRGITGVIMAPPYFGNRSIKFHWSRYAAVGVGFGAEEQDLRRVAFDQLYNYITAFLELRKLGYRRIGTVLSSRVVHGSHHIGKWYAAYMHCQHLIPENEQIPVMETTDGQVPESGHAALKERLRQWVSKWRPDVILSTVGEERAWLEEMGFRIPRDIGIACFSRPVGSNLAGIDEKSEVVGATALELVAAQLAHNEIGLPAHLTAMMIEGQWCPGPTVKCRKQ